MSEKKTYIIYDKVSIHNNRFSIHDPLMNADSANKSRILLKIYLRRESDREWFQADVNLPKSFIKEIKGLT